MSYKTYYDNENDIINCDLSGDVRNEDVLSFVGEMVDITLKTKCTSWIINYEKANYRLGTMEIFDLPEEVLERMEALNELRYKVKRAIIRVRDRDNFAFLQDVARNRGHNLKVVDTYEAAF